MGIGEAFKAFWSGYFRLNGCAPRSEFWWNFLINVVLAFIPIIGVIYNVATLIPSVTLMVRRMHDINLSGWWYWLFMWFVLPFFIIAFIPSRPSKYRKQRISNQRNFPNINSAKEEE